MRWFAALTIMLVLLAGCGEEVPAAATPQGAYPAPQGQAGAYPEPQGAGSYPSPLEQGPKFTINRPVKLSDTQVTGTGPAGVPITLVSFTNSGEVIAETTIGADGTFTFDVGGKLIEKDQVGLKLGDVAGTAFDPQKFISGPGYQDTPYIGILFDMAPVEQ